MIILPSSPNRRPPHPTKSRSPRKALTPKNVQEVICPTCIFHISQNSDNIANLCKGCPSHSECPPIDKHEFKTLLNRAYKVAVEAFTSVGNTESPEYLEGLDLMHDFKEGVIWRVDECCYCVIREFICGPSAMPWILGLSLLGDDTNFDRSLKCFAAIEDMEAVGSWVRRIEERRKRMPGVKK
jgi:hypothetical protein